MNKFGNLLWKIFSATMVFLWHIDTVNAADSTTSCSETCNTNSIQSGGDPKIATYFTYEGDPDRETLSTVTLCPSGYYVSSCGMAVLGTNWLYGMNKNKTLKTGTETQYPCKCDTANYFSYSENYSTDKEDENKENLRKFFAGKEIINYTAKIKVENSSNYSYESKSVMPVDYKKARNIILSNFCTNERGELTDDLKCEPCPNNAMIPASTVKRETYAPRRVIYDTWNIHTIADCYMDEFSDTTGTYVYVSKSSDLSTGSGEKCYYSDTKSGSYLYYQ